MLLFVFFTSMSFLRLTLYPKVAINLISDFSQTSYLGAIPIAFDTIIVGIVIFYGHRQAAIWSAFSLFWVSTFLTTGVVFGSVFVMHHHQGEHELGDITGVYVVFQHPDLGALLIFQRWLLTFIPMIVTSASGSSILPYVDQRAGVAVMVASIMMWSLGLGMCYIILAIYFWRLVICKLPAREFVISCFVPVGPLGMGAYAIQNLAAGLATHVSTYNFTLERAPQAPVTIQTITAIAESIHWLGILIAFCLLGLGTFFLVEAIASVWAKFPRSFNIGFWSFVFPCGVYANALCRLGTDLRNSGLKWFAATCVLATILLWLGCALATFYHGVWLGKLFYTPGQQGWAEQERIDELRKSLAEKGRSGHFTANGGHKCKADMMPTSSESNGTCADSRRGVNGTLHMA